MIAPNSPLWASPSNHGSLEYSSRVRRFASTVCSWATNRASRLMFEPEDMPVLAAASYLARSMSFLRADQSQLAQHASRTTACAADPYSGLGLDSIARLGHAAHSGLALVKVIDSRRFAATVDVDGEHLNVAPTPIPTIWPCLCWSIGCRLSARRAVDANHRRLRRQPIRWPTIASPVAPRWFPRRLQSRCS